MLWWYPLPLHVWFFPQAVHPLSGMVISALSLAQWRYGRKKWGYKRRKDPYTCSVMVSARVLYSFSPYQVHAHFAAGQNSRAQDLIRLMWGYMLNKAESTQSTFWEGYYSNGSFAYQGIYMSNAHGWATGPASALSFYTLGIRPLSLGTPKPPSHYFKSFKIPTPKLLLRFLFTQYEVSINPHQRKRLIPSHVVSPSPFISEVVPTTRWPPLLEHSPFARAVLHLGVGR